jgi:hypothetical protein
MIIKILISFYNLINLCFVYAAYKSIYIYSVCQMLCIKFKKNTLLLTDKYFKDPKINCKYSLELVDFGGVLYTINYKNVHSSNKQMFIDFISETNKTNELNEENKADIIGKIKRLIMYNKERYETTKYITDKVMLYNFDNINWVKEETDVDNNITYTRCSYKFISIILRFTLDINTTHEIKLSNDEYNFYIVGNKINIDFVLYYCKNILNLKGVIDELIINDMLRYTLSIVDADVNMIDICENDEIILYENSYIKINK